MANGPFYEIGRYVCEVLDQAMGESSTGNPQFILKFRVMGKPTVDNSYDPIPQQYERTAYRSITEKTIPYFVEDLKALGYQHSSFKFLDPNTPGFQNFVGKLVDMFCNHEDDQSGNLRERWGVARKTSGLSAKAIEPKKMRELDNLFGKHLKDMEHKAEQPRATAVTAQTPITDDDIPF